MSYIGNPIVSTDFPVDTFSGNGSTTAFTLTQAPASVNAIIVAVSGVLQEPSTYTISGTTLTFTAAPPSGTSNISVRHLGVAGIPNTPVAGSVQYSSLNSSLQGTLVGRNRIINGAMVIDQRNAGASLTATDGYITLDRYYYFGSQASKFTIGQNLGSVTPPSGFRNYLGLSVSAAVTVGSSDYFFIGQKIEGFNVADFNLGTASAQTFTLSFWVRSSLTGTFGGSLRNGAQNRSYPFSYTISSANTWEQKSVTITGDTTGTWLTTNGSGLELSLSLGTGSTLSGTAGSWSGSNFVSATGATSVVGTNGATFYITGVQLEVGSTATSFDYRPYGTELALCQRYCFKMVTTSAYGPFGMGHGINTTTFRTIIKTTQTMRAQPSLSFSTASGFLWSFGNALSAIAAAEYGTDAFSIDGTTTGISANGGYLLTSNNNTTSFILATAEL